MESNKIEKQTASNSLKPDGTVWVGGETSTWMSVGGLIGILVGMIAGVCVSVALWINLRQDFGVAGVPLKYYFLMLVAPALGVFFGGFAGVLVGIGTPRINPRPEQGHRVHWTSIVFRRHFRK